MKTAHDVKKLFASYGYTVTAVRCNRHWVVTAVKQGRIGRFVISRSPRSPHVKQVIEADLKRGGHPPRGADR